MKRAALYIALIVILSVDCGRTYEVTEHSGNISAPEMAWPHGKMSFEEAHAELVGEDLTIVTVGGLEHEGTIVDVTPQAVTFQPEDSTNSVKIALDSVIKLESSPSFGSIALWGCGGFVLGGNIGAATTSGSKDVGKGIAGAIGGVLGCGVGTAARALSVTVYTCPRDTTYADGLPRGVHFYSLSVGE